MSTEECFDSANTTSFKFMACHTPGCGAPVVVKVTLGSKVCRGGTQDVVIGDCRALALSRRALALSRSSGGGIRHLSMCLNQL